MLKSAGERGERASEKSREFSGVMRCEGEEARKERDRRRSYSIYKKVNGLRGLTGETMSRNEHARARFADGFVAFCRSEKCLGVKEGDRMNCL